ncbi:MAG TPA: inositol monophosphatase family protein [candidate division Zixibacteria bacterium]|nr:inositol monophosphatase family protein [candidate division Zixibacteria bacterium]
MSRFLQVAKRAAREGAGVARSYYEKNLTVELKADRSPVTRADRETEKTIIRIIRAEFPDHSFFGEEFGRSSKKSDYVWIIDPIDGTKNFIAGIPLWGTLIALMHKNEIIVGVSYISTLKEMIWAERGKGAFLNGRPIRVSQTTKLSDSMISFGSLPSFKRKRLGTKLLNLLDRTRRQRSFGDLWPYHLLASGRLEIVVEASIRAYDVAPFVVIVNEAGGETSDLAGNPFSLEISSFIATNGKQHRKVVSKFSKVVKV